MTHVPGQAKGWRHQQQFTRLQELPPVAVCANFDFTWDHSGLTRTETNSCIPSVPLGRGGTGGGNGYDSPVPNPPATPPYNDVPYLNGYSATYPIASDPAMEIDP